MYKRQVAALSKKRLQELYDFATGLGLEVLVETHNLAELEIAHRIGAPVSYTHLDVYKRQENCSC